MPTAEESHCQAKCPQVTGTKNNAGTVIKPENFTLQTGCTQIKYLLCILYCFEKCLDSKSVRQKRRRHSSVFTQDRFTKEEIKSKQALHFCYLRQRGGMQSSIGW